MSPEHCELSYAEPLAFNPTLVLRGLDLSPRGLPHGADTEGTKRQETSVPSYLSHPYPRQLAHRACVARTQERGPRRTKLVFRLTSLSKHRELIELKRRITVSHKKISDFLELVFLSFVLCL